MQWLNVTPAMLTRLWRYACRASSAIYRRASAGGCHTAPITSAKPSPDVTPQSVSVEAIIHRRAIRLHNRSQAGAALYVARHTPMIQHKGR